ncbi:30S ribosomal protein S8 [Candidatus Parcubacteria bacterium]|nr:30S ribosomal protein S8 [Candidatus Parcubacteria bacterium]
MDTIVDMLNRIRNAQMVEHPSVNIPFSNFKYEIAKILEKQGFLGKVEKKGRKTRAVIEIALKYQDKRPAIQGLKRVSKQGQRIYSVKDKLKKVKGGFGMSVISTSKGLMTDEDARKQNLGGEIICEVW